MNIRDGAPALVARPRTPRSCFRRQIKQVAFALLLVAVSKHLLLRGILFEAVARDITVATIQSPQRAGLAMSHDDDFRDSIRTDLKMFVFDSCTYHLIDVIIRPDRV